VKEPGTLTLYSNSPSELWVLQADPRIWIQAGMVAMLRAGVMSPAARFADDVLTIDAANRRVVYRLREYLPGPDCWLAEWPD
jgi:hypothetical protein